MATITTAGAGNLLSTTPNAPWPSGTLPQTTDDVVIAHACTLTAGQSVTYKTLQKSGTGSITTAGACSILNTPCSHQAGTSTVFVTIGTGSTLTFTGSSMTAGAASGAHGFALGAATCVIVGGTITGGSVSGVHGINYNYGAPTGCTITGGSVSGAHGISANYGAPTGCTITGGSVSGTYGIYYTSGAPTGCTITGGSVSGAYGISANYGAPTNCTITGGSVAGAYALYQNRGTIYNPDSGIISDGTERAIYENTAGYGAKLIALGSLVRSAIPTGLAEAVIIGPLHASGSLTGVTPRYITWGPTRIFGGRYAR